MCLKPFLTVMDERSKVNTCIQITLNSVFCL